MRPEHHAVAEVECVVGVEGGVVRGEIERGEIVPLRFRFGPERDGEAEAAEDVLDLLDHLRDGMSCTTPALARRHGAVDRCFRDSRLLELPTPVFEPALEACLDGVDQRAGFAKLLWRERRQLLEELRKSSRFSAEQRRARFLERRGVTGRVDRFLALSGEGRDELLEFGKRHASIERMGVSEMERTLPRYLEISRGRVRFKCWTTLECFTRLRVRISPSRRALRNRLDR